MKTLYSRKSHILFLLPERYRSFSSYLQRVFVRNQLEVTLCVGPQTDGIEALLSEHSFDAIICYAPEEIYAATWPYISASAWIMLEAKTDTANAKTPVILVTVDMVAVTEDHKRQLGIARVLSGQDYPTFQSLAETTQTVLDSKSALVG